MFVTTNGDQVKTLWQQQHQGRAPGGAALACKPPHRAVLLTGCFGGCDLAVWLTG